MKQLCTKDVFAGARLVTALNLNDEIKEICENADSLDDIWNIGFSLVMKIMAKATTMNAEKSIYEFLANPFEMTPEEIAELEFEILVEKLKEFKNINKNLVGFFKKVQSVLELMK